MTVPGKTAQATAAAPAPGTRPFPDPLAEAAAALDAVADGLFGRLSTASAQDHEERPGGALAELKAAGATTLLIPRRDGGRGGSAVDAVRFQRALGTLAPSAAIATTMHHYKIAALARVARAGDPGAAAVLRDLAEGSKLLASGGAESTPGRDLRSLGSSAARDGSDYVVTGLKRPCSLSMSMDVLSLMVELRAPDGTPEGYAQAFVPAGTEGLTREPFWRSPVFLAAESHAIRLSQVRISAERIFPLRGEEGRRFATDCYTWFQLLIAASYLGVANCIALAMPAERRADSAPWRDGATRLAELEQELVAAADAVDRDRPAADQLNLAVRARDLVEDRVAQIGGTLLRAAGGRSFALSGLPTVLTGALNALAFHPPQRGAREGVGLELLDSTNRQRS